MWPEQITHKFHVMVNGTYSLHYFHTPLHLTDYLTIAKP